MAKKLYNIISDDEYLIELCEKHYEPVSTAKKIHSSHGIKANERFVSKCETKSRKRERKNVRNSKQAGVGW